MLFRSMAKIGKGVKILLDIDRILAVEDLGGMGMDLGF